jgi:hypothetical protein
MSFSVNGSTGITFNDNTNMATAASLGPRNRIINGNMAVDQRNAGAAVTPTGSGYILDRWKYATSQASKLTFQQSATAPSGFNNSTKISVASAYTASASDYFVYQQIIEGYNVADLNFGTASAKTVTLSFWVQSSLTGTYSGCLQNGTPDRSYVFTYSIASANTWTQISITIAGDTTGTWNTTNGNGLTVDFDLGSGSNYQNAAGSWVADNKFTNSAQANFVGTASATFYITGVQLEVGSVATPFEYNKYSDQLAQCQRYCYVSYSGTIYTPHAYGYSVTSTYTRIGFQPPVTMRAAPSLTYSGNIGVANGSDSLSAVSALTIQDSGINMMTLQASTASSFFTIGQGARILNITDGSGKIILSAEL